MLLGPRCGLALQTRTLLGKNNACVDRIAQCGIVFIEKVLSARI
jgi:hypothetical protein